MKMAAPIRLFREGLIADSGRPSQTQLLMNTFPFSKLFGFWNVNGSCVKLGTSFIGRRSETASVGLILPVHEFHDT